MPKFGVPTDEQLAKINKLAKRTLSADEVFVFPGKLAGDMIIPDRYVQLTPELLRVFAQNAQEGVSLLIDHSWHADGFWGLGGRPKAAIPYGRTFNASLDKSNAEGETVELNADHYIVRGMAIDGVSTDDLIIGIEAGTLFDSSIGFSYNTGICSVCGENYFDSDKCEHRTGKTYEVEVDGVTKNILCYIKAQPPGALWENSLVFDGAYPAAGVLSKAGDILENEHGIYQVITELKDINPDKPVIATYSQRTGLLTMVKKSDHKKPYAIGGLVQKAQGMMTDQDSIFALGEKLGMSKKQVENIAKTVLKGGESKMNEKVLKMFEAFGVAFKEGETKLEDAVNQLCEKYAAIPVLDPKEGEAISYMTQEQVKEKLGKDYTADEVLKLAKEGQEMKPLMLKLANQSGTRRFGIEGYNPEKWSKLFNALSPKELFEQSEEWDKEMVKLNIIPEGRQTDPGAGLEQKGSSIPDEAFKVGK